jgi:hypothetical protein
MTNISCGPETPPADNHEPTSVLDQPMVTDNTWYKTSASRCCQTELSADFGMRSAE